MIHQQKRKIPPGIDGIEIQSPLNYCLKYNKFKNHDAKRWLCIHRYNEILKVLTTVELRAI